MDDERTSRYWQMAAELMLVYAICAKDTNPRPGPVLIVENEYPDLPSVRLTIEVISKTQQAKEKNHD